MRAFLAALLLLLCTSFGVRAAPAIWEVRDTDSAIRLFGSIHVLPPDVEWRTPVLEKAIAASDHVYFETDIGPRGIFALTVKMTVAAFQTASAPWLHLLTPADRERLEAAIAPLGLTLEDAGGMPPWLLSMELVNVQLSGAEDAASDDLFFTAGVEWTLQWELDPERKAFLETPGEQFDLLAAGTIEEQVDALLATLEEADGGETLAELVEVWAAGDVEAIGGTTTAGSEAEREGLEVLLFERNRNWIPALEKLLADNHEDLVVVGAAHLAGDGSVLDLLAEAGYTVTRIQ